MHPETVQDQRRALPPHCRSPAPDGLCSGHASVTRGASLSSLGLGAFPCRARKGQDAGQSRSGGMAAAGSRGRSGKADSYEAGSQTSGRPWPQLCLEGSFRSLLAARANRALPPARPPGRFGEADHLALRPVRRKGTRSASGSQRKGSPEHVWVLRECDLQAPTRSQTVPQSSWALRVLGFVLPQSSLPGRQRSRS